MAKRNFGDEFGFQTRAVHTGNDVDSETGAIKRPITMANSYELPYDPSDLNWSSAGKNLYTRNGGSNQQYLQEKLASLEGGEDCIVLASGVAALSGFFFALLKSGDHVVFSSVTYIAVYRLLNELLKDKFGVETTIVDTTDIEKVKAAIRPNTKLIHIETPGNPTLSISDIEKIAELVRDKRIEGISDIRDESDREGMRIVIELKRDAKPEVVKNNLFKFTQLHTTFGVNMLALVGKQPRLMNLYEVLNEFVEHRVEIVTRRTIFFLKKAKIRAHILAGLMIALGSLDEVIELIKKSKTTDEARNGLMSRFGLDADQANAILEMQLRRLTGLEQDKIKQEYEELKKKIAEYEAILADRQKVLNIIKEELLEDKEKYGDDRRTQIIPEVDEMTIEDLTPNLPMAVFITRQGYLKRISLDTFERQNRATRGKGGIKTKEDDDVEQFFTAMMHDKVLFFSSKGTVYSLNVYDFPEGGRQAKGLPIINVLPLEQDEQITAVVPVSDFKSVSNLIMLTQKGYIKRIALDNFENIRRNGIIAIGLEEGDTLCWVKQAQDNDEVIIGTSCGMAIRFPIADLRPLGRSARGVNSMKLRSADKIIGCDIVPRNYDADLLVVTSDGFGKRSKLSDFRTQNRGGLGLIATKFKSSQSRLVALTIVEEKDEIMVVTQNGVVTRIKADCISRQGRPATGVRIQNLGDGDMVCTVNKIVDPDSDDDKIDCDLPKEAGAENNSVQQSILGGLSENTDETKE